MKKYFGWIILGALLAGCSVHVSVMDGDCEPINNATIYYTREGIESFMPFRAFTNQDGIAKLPVDTETVTVIKEGFKSAFIEEPVSKNIDVFMYTDSDEYESGLLDHKNCKERKQ